jgi:hypothetical protein
MKEIVQFLFLRSYLGITIEEDCGDWLRASLNGKEGYVPYNYIQRQQ